MNKTIKRSFALIAIVSLTFELVFQIVGGLLIEFGSEIYKNQAFSMTVAGFMALLSGFLILGYYDIPSRKNYKKFSILKFLWILLLLRGFQIVAVLLDSPIINWLYHLGYTMESAIADATGSNISDKWDVLYSILFAPIIEECFFRGMIYNKLRKYGSIFAITITAFLFGLMHCNIFQFFTGFVIGILFAWVRATYGLRYSILIHASNNIFAVLMNRSFSTSTPGIIFMNLMFLGGILTLLVTVFVNFRSIQAAFQRERTLPKMFLLWFTTIPVILITILFLIFTFQSVIM
ncbi:MAG: CPBP family intramembrane metalloprotease [Lachnospiraceae bacterium]|nr:CPBP family intramembrane metalloprotease [Lachnospiraceae bacterium]